MNLYLIYQHINHTPNTYIGAVVVAENADIARRMHPRNGELDVKVDDTTHYDWVDTDHVTVAYLGKADIIDKRTVICTEWCKKQQTED